MLDLVESPIPRRVKNTPPAQRGMRQRVMIAWPLLQPALLIADEPPRPWM